MLEKLAIWFLKKRKVSIIIGFAHEGGAIRPLNRDTYLYDNTFDRCQFLEYNGAEFQIPEGKFQHKGIS